MNEQQICWAFSVLGLPRNATKEQVKHAYRTLCKQYHPDKSLTNDTVQKYLMVQQAYEIICYMFEYQQKLQQQQNLSYFYNNINNSYKYGNCYTSGTSMPYQNTTQGRVFGNNETVQQNYNKMQERQAEINRLRQWEHNSQQKKQRTKEKKMQEFVSSRKLPSEKEEEKRTQLERQKEAERIAGIIQAMLRLSENK